MGGGIALARWSRLLVDEIFEDREGEGRPVSTIDAGEALLARALGRAGPIPTDRAAIQLFLSAFPARSQMLRWFSGVDSPADAIPSFLILCCVAASETTGSDTNDYRDRLKEMMAWDAPITECGALPGLWRKLQAALAAAPPERRLRPLILPDPRFRTQIGHAIELTFPSRQDGRRLKRDLEAGGLADPNSPVAVMRWVGARVGNYSPTFHETFSDFQAAWRDGARALTDHRFWSGWRVVVDSWRPKLTQDDFLIVSDVWGGHQLVTVAGEPTTLRAVETAASGGLRHLLADGSPILLRESDWGQYTWAGQGRAAAREARAALVREKSHSATVLAQLDRHPVADAPGWFLTTAVDLVPGAAGRSSLGDDDLIDIHFHGVPRVDGGRLARPSFPLKLSMTGPVGSVTVAGALAGSLTLRRLSSQEWWITPTGPLEGEVKVLVEAPAGEVARSVSLRRSSHAPDWERALPARLLPDEQPSPAWSATAAANQPIGAFEVPSEAAGVAVRQGVLDLAEFLAARPSPMPLGGFVELLDSLPGAEEIGKWTLLRLAIEGGLVDPYRVRGWRGGAVAPRAPRAVLATGGHGSRLIFDGVITEVTRSRIDGAASRRGMDVTTSPGLSAWSPTTVSVSGESMVLIALADELGLAYEHLAPNLTGHTRPSEAVPDANGATHLVRKPVFGEDADALLRHGVRLFLCRREAEDAAPVWLVQADGREPRYWTHRHIAILDACHQAGLPIASIRNGAVVMTLPGMGLPLQVARWFRLATCAAAGSQDGVHVYGLTSAVEPVARLFLGLATSTGRANLPASRRGRGLAVARGGSIDVVPSWRWAREGRGVVQ
jgi:hypothetical protein